MTTPPLLQFDFEVVQHLAAQLDRSLRTVHIPSLKGALSDVRAVRDSGMRCSPVKQRILVSRLSVVSGAIEQLAILYKALGEAPQNVQCRHVKAALSSLEELCRRLEDEGLSLLSMRGAY